MRQNEKQKWIPAILIVGSKGCFARGCRKIHVLIDRRYCDWFSLVLWRLVEYGSTCSSIAGAASSPCACQRVKVLVLLYNSVLLNISVPIIVFRNSGWWANVHVNMYKRVGIHTGTLFKRNTHIEEHGGLLASWSHELARITTLFLEEHSYRGGGGCMQGQTLTQGMN